MWFHFHYRSYSYGGGSCGGYALSSVLFHQYFSIFSAGLSPSRGLFCTMPISALIVLPKCIDCIYGWLKHNFHSLYLGGCSTHGTGSRCLKRRKLHCFEYECRWRPPRSAHCDVQYAACILYTGRCGGRLEAFNFKRAVLFNLLLPVNMSFSVSCFTTFIRIVLASDLKGVGIVSNCHHSSTTAKSPHTLEKV